MTAFVKICGVTTAEALDAAVEAGADAVGFVFHGPSLRNIEPRCAAALARRLPRGVLCIAITLGPQQWLVDSVLEWLAPDAWQSDACDFGALEIPAAIARWPVLRGPGSPPAGARRVLFESTVSGSGRLADWSAARAMARGCELILGGGLDPTNVADAIAAVRPFGVDVSSGVERSPGLKNPALIHAFVQAAHGGARARTA